MLVAVNIRRSATLALLRTHAVRYILRMPPQGPQPSDKTLLDVVEELGLYPIEAFAFVNEGLAFTAVRIHGERKSKDQDMHVTGRQLSEGLRDYATLKYGMLAGTVLRRWGINATFDFGRIVYAMIDAGIMSRNESDSIEDFRNVYDFRAAFDHSYQIPG